MTGDDQLSIGRLAHPIDRPRHARPSRVFVAPRRLCHDRNILGRPANDRPIRIECGYRSDIDKEAGIPPRTLPDHLGARLQAEQRTTLCVRNTWCRGSRIPCPFHIHSTRLSSRSARIACSTELLRVCFLASVLVLRLCHGRCSQNEGEREHSAPHCETSLINQSVPHEINFSKRPALLEWLPPNEAP